MQAIDLKEFSGGNCDQKISQCLFYSAGSAGYIDLFVSHAMAAFEKP